MTMQFAITLVFLALAAGYLARRGWNTWYGAKAGCGGGCDCSASKGNEPAEKLILPEQITLRRRAPGDGR